MKPSTSRLLLILLILIIGVFFRLWQFALPGLQHDEIFKAQEGQALVEKGYWRLFYPSNQGHEGGYVWLNGLSYQLFGANRVMIKMPPLWCGLLTLALLYRVGCDLFNRRVGWLAAGLGAVSFWLVFTNRVGLRANLLPLVTLGVMWGLNVILKTSPYPLSKHGEGLNWMKKWRVALLTGILLGFAIYTYTAAFVLYLAYGLFLAMLALFERPTFKKHLPELALITVLGLLLALPMLYVRLNDPQGQNRVSTINQPYTELKAGNWEPVLTNAKLLLGMPLFSGDPEWRYNVAGRPLFIAPVGLLVYLGFGLVLWRGKKPLYALLLALAILGLIPSLLTSSAPSFLRSIITLPSLLLFAGVAFDEITRRGAIYCAPTIGVVLIVGVALLDGRAYFHTWLNAPPVGAIYRDDLAQLATQTEPLIFATTPEPAVLDPAIYAFSGASVPVVWFDGTTTLVLSEAPNLLFVSPYATISPAHADWLTAHQGQLLRHNGAVAFEIYQVGGALLSERLAQVSQAPIFLAPSPPFPSDQLRDWGAPTHFPINLGGIVQLVGMELPSTQIPPRDNGVDTGLNLQLYLQPLVSHYDQPISLFVHFIAWDGSVFAGRDFIGVPPPHWQTGIIFIQDNYIGNFDLEARPYFLSVGLYNTLTGERYPILGAEGEILGDNIILGQLEVVPD